jgi:hypothetical protein
MKRKALALIEQTGATLDPDMLRHDNYTLDAPEGKRFAANGEESYFVGNYDRSEIQFGGMTMLDIWGNIHWVLALGYEEDK